VGGLVVLDEAYQPFASRTYLTKLQDDLAGHTHVLLMRTLSKFGLAGVRLGYMLGASALIAEIDKLRPPYNVSVLNAECGLFALEHAAVFAAQAQDIKQERERLQAELQKAQQQKVELQREWNNGEPERRADEFRQPQKYQERVAQLRASLQRMDADIAGLQRELSRLPGTTTNGNKP
jgi:aspartate/methionine/tyrosine aminotransferase